MRSIDTIKAGLSSIIQAITGCDDALPLSTSVYHDLNIAADDAIELLTEISRCFGVSFAGFSFSQYFPDENEVGWLYFGRLLGLRDDTRQPLTFGHLVEVVKLGHWFAPASS